MSIGDLLGTGNHRGDPDYIVTLDGKPIPTEDILSWNVVDDEETASSITVEVENGDYRYSGKVKIGAKLAIRFGYVGFLIGKATFPVMAFKEHYTTSSGCTLTINGKDPTQKQGGNKHSGAHESKDPKKAVESTLDTRPGDVSGGGSGMSSGMSGVKGNPPKNILNERNKPAPILFFNESIWEFQRRMMPLWGQEDKATAGVNDVYPEEPKAPEGFKGEQSKGDSQSGSGNANDKNRGNDSGGKGGQDPVKATIKLIGYPELKAKKNIKIVNVGPEASGTYYVKQCRHHIAKGGGNYTTDASLIRGGTGKGGSGTISGCSPCVSFSDIYGGGSYFGPRQYGSKEQDTLTFGSGGPLISFDLAVAPQGNRGGGKDKGKTRGHDLTNRAKPKASDDDRPNSQQGSQSQQELEQRGTE